LSGFVDTGVCSDARPVTARLLSASAASVAPCEVKYAALASMSRIELVRPDPAGSGETGGGGLSSGVSVVGVGSVSGGIGSGAGAGSVGGAVAAGSVVGIGSVSGGIGSGAGAGSVGGAVAGGSVVGVGSAGCVAGEGSTGSVAELASVAAVVPPAVPESPLPASVAAMFAVVVLELEPATAAVAPTSPASCARASIAKPNIQRSATLNVTVNRRPSPGTLTPLAVCRETDAKLDNKYSPTPTVSMTGLSPG
jgi:hypothetical protein